MWIYRYLRRDSEEEIDMGPYNSKEEAQEASDKYASLGAITSGAIEVPDDYNLFEGN